MDRSAQNTPLLARRWLWMSLIGLVTVTLLLLRLRGYIHLYDEGFHILVSKRMALGEVPYRDFSHHYLPGNNLAIAALYKLFGVSLLPSRLFDAACRLAAMLLLAAIVWRPSLRPTPGQAALLGGAAIVSAITLVGYGAWSYVIYPALAASLASLWALVRYGESGRRRWLWLAGLLTGLAFVVRWDMATYLFGVQAGALIWMGWVQAQRRTHTGGAADGAAGRASGSALDDAGGAVAAVAPGARLQAQVRAGDALPLLGGFLIGALPVVLWAGLRGGFNAMWELAFVFPMTDLRTYRSLPLPGLLPTPPPLSADGAPVGVTLLGLTLTQETVRLWLGWWLALLAAGALLLRLLFLTVKRRLPATPPHFALVVLAGYGTLLVGQAINRYDDIHAQPMRVVLWVTVALSVVLGLWGLQGRRRTVAALVGGVATAALLWLFLRPPVTLLQQVATRTPPWGCYSTMPVLDCAAALSDFERTQNYVEVRLPAGQPLFVGLTRHDITYMNDMAFYWASPRQPATYYHLLEPGLVTTAAVQERIVADLERSRPDLIVRVLFRQPPGESEAARTSTGVRILDDYLIANYTPERTFGIWQVDRRNGTTP
jgi:hypothetical protein